MRVLVFLITALALAGCSAVQTLTANDDETCQSFGAKPGTDVYVQCRVSQQARRDAATADIGQRMQAAGQAMQSASPPPAPAPTQSLSTPTNCTSTRTMPNTVNTHCY